MLNIHVPVRILVYAVLVAGTFNWCTCDNEQTWAKRVNLPPEHVAFFFNNHAGIAERCRRDVRCPFKMHLDRQACWGYEMNCTKSWQYSTPSCLGDDHGWAKNKLEQQEIFYKQSDFGYIREKQEEMHHICMPRSKVDSSLECTSHLQFCRGRDIFFNFSSILNLPHPIRYRMDIIQEGQVGGGCQANYQKLKSESDHFSPLQSWAPELQHFIELDENPVISGKCDIIVPEPTFIMKLDAPVNMYHHFCDFFNLYATLHLNNTFSTNIRILIWDNMAYRSNFGTTWKAFTRHPVQDLQQYIGKTVCFRNVIFPLLPRMIFGMYYNMPLISGCERSGLFHAFSHHILHRLHISQEIHQSGKVRVTLLARSTTYRQILNQDQLVRALKSKHSGFEVRKVDFNWNTPFLEQLKIIYNTDVLIGIHGAGLTHMLFLPDWAAVFEIYNCEDEGCYRDLARLRGVGYFTWEDLSKLKAQDKGHHPTEGAHAKFTNYEFNLREFMRIMEKAKAYVKAHSQWHENSRDNIGISPTHTEL